MVCGEVPNVTPTGWVHTSPAEDETVKLTDPVNPFRAVTVKVELPEAPASIWLGDTGPALMLKSTTTKLIAAVL